MARGTLRFEGIADLSKGLKRRADLTDVKRTVKLNGSEMHRKTVRNAPVDTGNLQRNIKYHSQNQGYTAKVASEAEYAPYQEYGTRFQSGKPHIRPAFYEQRRKFISDMKRLMK